LQAYHQWFEERTIFVDISVRKIILKGVVYAIVNNVVVIKVMTLKKPHERLKSKNLYITILIKKPMYILLLIVTSTCKNKTQHYIKRKVL
jgi:hypothetical protein